jgi:hypothetical protein
MKKIIGYIRDFIKEDFNPKFYVYTVLYLGITISFNYLIDFEDTYLDSYFGSKWGIVYYFLFYAFPYYSISLAQSFFLKANFHWSSAFWIKSLVILVMLALHANFYYHGKWIQSFQVSDIEYRYLYRLIYNLYPIVVYVPVLWVLKIMYDRNTNDGLYGLSFKRFDPIPYFIFLLIMAPLIFMASFLPDFMKVYPRLKPSDAQQLFEWPEWIAMSIFEFFYLLDFVRVELIFRGVLVIGLVRIMGRHAILPMVVTYAFLHFGKPLGETIGSIFGGYILGIIALYSRSILGGVAIHMGVAFFMELMALVQFYLIRSE